MIHSKPSKLTQALIYATIGCERFAWYLMLSGLVLALVERGLDKSTASKSYGLLLLAAYLTPLIGGWFGGKYTLRKSVVIGTATLTLGYGLGTQGYILPMLGLLAIGCGMFKPCLSTLLALLYPAGDPAKVKAMGRYYLAVQLGSLPSAFVGGWLRLHYGWGIAYSAAMLGAFLALSFALLAWRRLVPYKSDLEALVQTSVDLPTRESWQLGPLVTLLTVGALFWAANQQQVMAAWLGTSAIGGYVAGALGGVSIWWACWLTMGLCMVGAGVAWLWWPVRGELVKQVIMPYSNVNQEVQSWA